jgi:Pyruvate/2-oxoacid:ferredoxin oxidoreductase delta subunit
MVLRKILKIDDTLCNGCGNCAIACAEGAIVMANGKARVVSDNYCDGLGACIGECRAGALTIEERETVEFDSIAAKERMRLEDAGDIHGATGINAHEKLSPPSMPPCCPSFGKSPETPLVVSPKAGPFKQMQSQHMSKLGPFSQLSSWPIQIRLAHSNAPYFKNADLLIAADCSAFACPSIRDFINGKIVLIGCPKLDETIPFIEKLTEILKSNDISSITVLHMEVPCCSNLLKLISEAIMRSEKKIPVDKFICMIGGDVVKTDKS